MLIFNNLRLFSDFVMSWSASGEFVIPELIHFRFTLSEAFKVDVVMRFYDYCVP